MVKRATLDVSLTPELTGLIAGRVAISRSGSVSEVVRVALRLPESEGGDLRSRLRSDTNIGSTTSAKPGRS